MSPLLLLLCIVMVGLVAGLWLQRKSAAEVRNHLESLRHEAAILSARIETLERHANEYWQAVETRIGKIHETFETGRACRLGSLIADVDIKMGHLNRKVEDLLNRMSRPERTSEGA